MPWSSTGIRERPWPAVRVAAREVRTLGYRAMSARPDIATAARVVVKVGSSSLTTKAGEIADDKVETLAAALAGRKKQGTELILVSSGAIASGLAPLGLT